MNYSVRLLSICLFLVMLSAVGHSAEKKQILVLNSYHKGYSWTDGLVKGIEETLTERIENCEILIEYMDTKRINTDEYKAAFFRLMKMKYAKINLDIIIVSDDNAFLFTVKYHRRLFGNTPVVFMGVNHFTPSMIDGHEDQITGIVQDADIPATLNTALKLHPNTTQVAVICDATTTGQGYIRQTNAAESQFETLKFIYLDGTELTTSEMLARLSSLPNNSIALLCIWLKDKNGVFVPWERGYPEISKKSPVPLYGVLESMLQYGILGGKVQSGKHHGAEAAKIALKLLEGKKVTDMPVRLESPNTYMFNYKQLQRWNIKKTTLPRGSIIIKEPQSAYYQYKNIAWGIIGTFAFLIVVIAVLGSNIIRRKSAEENLREGEQKYRLLVENLPGTIFRGYKDWSVEFFDNTIETFTGYNVDEFNSGRMKWIDNMVEEDIDTAKLSFIKALKTNKSYIREYRIKSKVEGIHWVQERGQIVCDNKGEIEYVSGVFFDVTDRRRAEEALRESEERYRTVLEANPDPVVVYDMEGKVIYFNPAFTRVFGWTLEERIRKKMDEFVPEETWEETKSMINKVLAGDSFSGLETRRYTKEGNIIHVNMSASIYRDPDGNPIGSVINLRDITKQKRLEAQLQQAQKMKAMGTLAGGIAHDFNNLLMGIQGRTSLMLMGSDSSHSNFEHLKGIENYVKSAADLTKQLLGFARGGKYEVKTTDLNELIKNQNHMFGRTRKEINIQEKFEENLWTVEIDRGQIEQVLLNIYVNAWQVMPGGGNLYLQSENTIIDEDYGKPYHVEPGRYVKISITDTGVGMDEATRQRIFDPFFTTKEMGRGTGLGLASAYGIIKNHNGFINVYSEKGEGTTFNIYLPASEKEAWKEKEMDEALIRGTETVLLVDDEDMIIEIGHGIIENLGYEVLIAKSGKEAIEIYKKNPDRIAMVILDMIMPNMGGGDTYDRLKEINSNVKVLLSSGYSVNGQASEILERGCDGFIQKPFNMANLSQKIRGILDKD